MFKDQENSDEVWGREPFVDEVVLKVFSPEIGKKQKRGHFNLVVEIYHQIDAYSLSKLRQRVIEFLDENYNQSNGWNVWVTLSKQYDVNYGNKEERWAKNDDVDHNDPEYLRLADDRDIYELTDKMNTIRLMDMKNNYIPGTKSRPYNKWARAKKADDNNNNESESDSDSE
jgi:hypothetical protein